MLFVGRMSKRCQIQLKAGASVMVQQVTHWHPIAMLVSVLAPLLMIQLPADAPGEAAEDGASVWAPAAAREVWMEFSALLCSVWLNPSDGSHCRVNSFSLSLSLFQFFCTYTFQIDK